MRDHLTHPEIETAQIGDQIALMSWSALTSVELAIHPGGGATLIGVLPGGDLMTVDLFPSLQGADEGQQLLLDSLGRALSIRIELAAISTPERPAHDPDDLTACPEPRRIDAVPMPLELLT